MPTKPLASQPCTCKDSFTLNTIDNEVKELLESCQKLRMVKPNFSLIPAYESGLHIKVKKILKGSLDSIPSPSPSVKIQIMGGKVGLRCKGNILLGAVNKLLKAKSLLTSASNVLPYYLE